MFITYIAYMYTYPMHFYTYYIYICIHILYTYTGTGKTATVLASLAALQREPDCPSFQFIEINCLRLQTPADACKYLFMMPSMCIYIYMLCYIVYMYCKYHCYINEVLYTLSIC